MTGRRRAAGSVSYLAGSGHTARNLPTYDEIAYTGSI